MLRRFSGLQLGELRIVNELKLDLHGKKAWFFHGDVFDVILQNSKWLAKLGAIGYDLLIWLNIKVNWLVRKLNLEPVSFSKKIKDSVKSAVKFINAFEDSAALVGVRKGFDYIVCGHIHHPEIRDIMSENRYIKYLNSGDWIENLSALEYNRSDWKIFNYRKDFIEQEDETGEFDRIVDIEVKDLFKNLVFEFN